MKKLLAAFSCLLYLNSFSQSSTAGIYLPSVLIDGRFYIKIPTPNGDTLLSFCDTGGGYNAIYQPAISKSNLTSKVLEVTIGSERTKYIPASEVIGSPIIPAPAIQDYYQPYIKVPFFVVPENDQETAFMAEYLPKDIFLGQFFFIGHSWTFDYLAGRLYINTPLTADVNNKNIQKIGFKKDKHGNKLFGHPSIQVKIDGDTLDVLFDTGASILPSKNTQAELKCNSKSIGGSFIAKSVFDKWRSKHPDWKFIEKGEVTGADMIQVPQVTIGTTTSGPVWFAKRRDEAWSKGMIQSMDKVVKGAIGGSFFQYYRVTIDYNNELAILSKEVE